MPFTPYHFGVGAAIKAVIPRQFSFALFCFAQVVIDGEVAYHMLRGEHPYHRWIHSLLGATAVVVFSTIVGRSLCRLGLRWWCAWPGAPFKRYFPATPRLSFASAFTGAVLGAYSHVFLDSFVHRNVYLFWPWSESNPFFATVDLFTLHAVCVLLGVVGVWGIARRREAE